MPEGTPERMAIAVIIFIATLTLIIWQPRGLGIGYSATAGALVALATGVVKPSDIPEVWHIVWNATLTFVALIIISLVLNAAGFFKFAALHVGEWGNGNARRLFVMIILLGAAISAIFANDGAALILTPIVLEMLLALGFSATSSFAFVIASGFIADTGSLPFVISNLVNIVSADYFRIGFINYAAVMVPVDVVSVAASTGVLFLLFRRRLPKNYSADMLPKPASAIVDHPTFRAGWVVLAVLLVGYFVADPLGVPVSAIAGAGAVVLLAVAGRHHLPGRRERYVAAGEADINALQIVREAPWQIVVFSLGMYLVVFGLRNEGLTIYLTDLIRSLAAHGTAANALGVGFVVAVLSAMMNNMPTVLIGALSIHAAASGAHQALVSAYANVIGADLGPKITPVGSLATLLWLHVLERKGVKIGWGTYFKNGVVLTLPVLLVTLLALTLAVSL